MSERIGTGATPIFDEDGDQGLIGWRDSRGRNWMVPRWSTDAAGNVALLGPDGLPADPGPDFGLLPEPWVITHRGAGAMLAPDSILESYALGIQFGTGIIDGGDWYQVADDGVWDWHDPTLDRISDQTGATTSATSPQMSRIRIDASSWFGGGWQDVSGAMTPEKFFGTLRGQTCFAPEPKDIGSANYLASYLLRTGLARSCLVNAFDDAFLAPFAAAGFPYLLRNLVAGAEHASFNPARAQQLRALGVRYLGVTFSDANAVAAATTAIAQGMKVMVTTPRRLVHIAPFAGLPIAGQSSDDPLYTSGQVSKYRRTTSPFGSGAYYHGHHNTSNSFLPGAGNRGTFANGRLVMVPSAGSDLNFILQGWGCPIAAAAGTYTITSTVVLTSRATADRTRWFGFVVCAPDDALYDDTGPSSTGYQIWINPSTATGGGAAGRINIIRKTAGAGTGQVQTTLSGELLDGATVTVAIAVTPTQITATVSGAVTGSVVIVDSTHRGGFFHVGHSSQGAGPMTGFQVEFGPITIT